MIYLIKSSAYSKEGNHIDILKIGYTGDTNKCSRIMTYYYHNPTCILLYTIPEATDLDEKRLHYRFRDYLFESPNFNCIEWYYYNDEIVDYFKTHTTKESLLDLEEAPENNRLAFIRFKNEVYKAVDYVLSVRCQEGSLDYNIANKQRDNLANIIYTRRIRTTRKLWEYVKDVFGLFPLEMQKLLDTNQLDKDTMNEVTNFMNRFNYLKQFTEKMKLLCTTTFSTERTLEIVLKQIPINYVTYYTILGPDRIKAFCYRRVDLERECSKLLESQAGSKRESIILSNFTVGKRYSIRGIKETLRLLYNQEGIQSTPKAVDLEGYFEVKKVKVPCEGGGRVDGYEILSIKNKD